MKTFTVVGLQDLDIDFPLIVAVEAESVERAREIVSGSDYPYDIICILDGTCSVASPIKGGYYDELTDDTFFGKRK